MYHLDKVKMWADFYGYSYQVVNRETIGLFFTGRNNHEIDVFFIIQGHLAIFGALLCHRDSLNNSTELYYSLLVLNNTIDKVKVGFNEESMLFTRIDTDLRTLDEQIFKYNVEQITAATDEIYSLISDYQSS